MRRHLATLTSASLLAVLAATGWPSVAVAAPPGNDNFSSPVTLIGLVAVDSGTNAEATGETGEPNHAGQSVPLESVWYSWTAPVSSEFSVDTCTTNYDTTLAVYTGSSVDALTEVASNDDSGVAGCGFAGNTLGSLVVFDAVAGTTYRIAVDGQGSNDGTFTLTVQPTAGVDTLTVHKSICADINEATLTEMAFVARAACVAGDATFEVTVDEVLVATVVTEDGSGTVDLVAGDYDVTEVSPALVGPEPITIAPDGSVTVVAENPAPPTPPVPLLPDAATGTGEDGSGTLVFVLLALLLVSAGAWAAAAPAARSRN